MKLKKNANNRKKGRARKNVGESPSRALVRSNEIAIRIHNAPYTIFLSLSLSANVYLFFSLVSPAVEPLHFCELINDLAVIDYSARFDGRSQTYIGFIAVINLCVSFEWDITIVCIGK